MRHVFLAAEQVEERGHTHETVHEHGREKIDAAGSGRAMVMAMMVATFVS
ncbi:MAG: hypothetical protein Q7J24_07460 [Desulfomicrobium sp.]|nr:hypothetical protein [Desulfomicrobium sp.]